MKPVLAAVGSATVAVLSQSSGIERPFFAMSRGHVVYNNCALYIIIIIIILILQHSCTEKEVSVWVKQKLMIVLKVCQ